MALLRILTEVGLDVLNQRLFIEVVADDFRHIGVDHLIVGDARSGRIGQRNIPRPPGTHQAGHTEYRFFFKHLGIEKQIIDPTVDHINPFQSCDRAHVDAIVLGNQQITPLHQLGTHLLGKVGMFEIGRVEDPRG